MQTKELLRFLKCEKVEYRALGEVCEVLKGRQLNKTELLESGKFPVMNGGINPSGFWNESNFKANRITISQGGASAEFVNFVTTPFWAGAHCYVIENEHKSVLYKFLYYILKNQQSFLMTSQYGAGIPALSKDKIQSLLIPLPPLEIQNEIVKILDTFTELETELKARRKQYEYYRNKLLSKEELAKRGEVKLMSLGEILTLEYGKSLRKQEMIEGNYPVCGSNGIIAYHNAYMVEGSTIIVGRKGSAGKLTFVENNCFPIDTTYYVKLKNQDNMKFIYYAMQLLNFEKLKSAGIPGINRNDIYNFQIPLPPLSVQNEIVQILDKFDTLVNDLSKGIPAEIVARRKQYEYYREKLLSFKEKV